MLPYTHRQKLSNSKLVLNIKKCFLPKYWKFKFYYLHLTSFEYGISVTEKRYYVTSVKAEFIEEGYAFSLYVFGHFVKGSILNRILRSCELSEGNRFVFMENPREDACQEKDTFKKSCQIFERFLYRSNIWHDFLNKKACQKTLKS